MHGNAQDDKDADQAFCQSVVAATGSWSRRRSPPVPTATATSWTATTHYQGSRTTIPQEPASLPAARR
jgi:hypothetical protein